MAIYKSTPYSMAQCSVFRNFQREGHAKTNNWLRSNEFILPGSAGTAGTAGSSATQRPIDPEFPWLGQRSPNDPFFQEETYYMNRPSFVNESRAVPHRRIVVITRGCLFMLGRIMFYAQEAPLLWQNAFGLKFFSNCAQYALRQGWKGFASPDKWECATARLLNRFTPSAFTLASVLMLAFLIYEKSQNEKLMAENQDLFVHSYYYARLGMANERFFLANLVSPFIMMLQLMEKYTAGAHKFLAGMNQEAPGFPELDKAAKDNPAQTMSEGFQDMLQISVFLAHFNEVVKQWRTFTPSPDGNTIIATDDGKNKMFSLTPMFQLMESYTNTLGLFNEAETQQGLKERLITLARIAESKVINVNSEWDAVNQALTKAGEVAQNSGDAQSLESVVSMRNSLEMAYANICNKKSFVNSIPHFLHLLYLTCYGTSKEVWNEQDQPNDPDDQLCFTPRDKTTGAYDRNQLNALWTQEGGLKRHFGELDEARSEIERSPDSGLLSWLPKWHDWTDLWGARMPGEKAKKGAPNQPVAVAHP